MQHLPKQERLHGKLAVNQLFDKSKRFTVYPLRVHYTQQPTIAHSRMLISIPKRLIKHATDRNLLKRRIREAYRVNKPELPIDIAFVYMDNQIATHDTLVHCIKKATEILNKRSTPIEK